MKSEPSSGITAFNCPNCGAAADPDSTQCPYCRSSLSVRICAACFGAVSIGMRHCPHCGAAMKSAAKTVAQELQCPRCECLLMARTIGSHSIFGCDQCGGLWLDKTSFQDICNREEEQEAVIGYALPPLPQTPPNKARRTYIPCPECKKLMNHKNFAGSSGVVLDWCREHGSWFDRQELHRIVQFIRSGGMRQAREREKEQMKAQEASLRMEQMRQAAWSHRMGVDPNSCNSRQSGDLFLKFLRRMFS